MLQSNFPFKIYIFLGIGLAWKLLIHFLECYFLEHEHIKNNSLLVLLTIFSSLQTFPTNFFNVFSLLLVPFKAQKAKPLIPQASKWLLFWDFLYHLDLKLDMASFILSESSMGKAQEYKSMCIPNDFRNQGQGSQTGGFVWDLFSSITGVIYWSKPEGFVLFLNQMHAFRT